jgi:hypothetical protein
MEARIVWVYLSTTTTSHCFGTAPFALLVHGTQPAGSDASTSPSTQRKKEGGFVGYNSKQEALSLVTNAGALIAMLPVAHNSLGNCKRCARRQANFSYKQKLVKQETKTQEDNS